MSSVRFSQYISGISSQTVDLDVVENMEDGINKAIDFAAKIKCPASPEKNQRTV